MLFEFERDFAGDLRCIPMIARMKLDLARVKLSLRQWNQISHEMRNRLVDMPGLQHADQEKYRETVLKSVEEFCDTPPKPLDAIDAEAWLDSQTVPDSVLHQAASDNVPPPSLDQWRDLSALQRFALVKLSRSKHENHNFVPAMREFDLLV